MLVASVLILVPSFALISSSQSNDTLSDDTLSDDTLSDDTSSNQSSFSFWSREFGKNQSESDGESGEDD
jgi:hypothetical protein